MTVVSGGTMVGPGGVVELAWHYRGRTMASPTRCEGVWAVYGIPGGDDAVGRIDDLRTVDFTRSQDDRQTCSDCPYASISVRIEP